MHRRVSVSSLQSWFLVLESDHIAIGKFNNDHVFYGKLPLCCWILPKYKCNYRLYDFSVQLPQLINIGQKHDVISIFIIIVV